MSNHPSSDLVSIGRAAEILGVSIDTVRRWEETGKLRAYRSDGGHRKFSTKELSAFKRTRPLSISEAATRLGVSASTLRRYEEAGRISPERDESGKRVYTDEIIESFLLHGHHASAHQTKPKKATRKPQAVSTKPSREPLLADKTIKKPATVVDSGLTKDLVDTQETIVDPLFVKPTISKAREKYQVLHSHVEAPISHPQPQFRRKPSAQKRRAIHAVRALAFLFILAGASILALRSQLLVPVQRAEQLSYGTSNNSDGVHGSNGSFIGIAANEPDERVLGISVDQLEQFFEVQIPAVFTDQVTVGELEVQGPTTLSGNVEGPGIDINLQSGRIFASNIVNSLQGATGDVNLVAGEGIEINGTTITNTSPNESQDAFSVITVGSNTVTADQPDEAVTFAASGDASVSFNTTTNTITIGATSETYTAGTDLQLNGNEFSIESTLDSVTTINGLTALDATSENTIEGTIFDADAESISGEWTVLDDVALGFGTDSDWTLSYDETDHDRLVLQTTNTAANNTSTPLFEVLVGTTPVANQNVFTIAKGTPSSNTDLLTVDEDGDVTILGALTLNGQTYTFPPEQSNGNGSILTTDGAGNLTWASAAGAGTADITAVGDCTSGGCFDGTAGTSLTFNDVDGDGVLTTANLTGAQTWTLPDASGTVILSGHSLSGDVSATLGTTGTTSVTVDAINGATLGSTTATSGNLLIANGSQWQTATLTGGATINSSGVLTIADNYIEEQMLNIDNAATDEFCLTYEGTSGNFEWTSCDAAGAFTSFIISDGVTSETVNNGETITFVDDSVIDFTVSATNQITAAVSADTIDGTQLADAITLDSATLSFQDSVANSLLTLTDAGTTGNLSITGDLTVSGLTTNGFVTVSSGALSSQATITLGTDTTGNYVSDVTGGNGVTASGSAGEGWAPSIAIDLLDSADGTSAVTSTNSGLEFQGASNNELALLQGCSDQQLLKWNDTTNVWFCASGSGTSAFDVSDGTTTETIQDSDILTFADGTSVNLVVSATDTVTADVIDDSIDGAELADAITLDSASLVFDDGTNTLLTLTDVGSTGNLSITGGLTVGTTTTLNGVAYTWPASIPGNDYVLTAQTDGTLAWANSAATADVISVGDCTSGACFDGTSDGGTYLDLYDAQGAGRLVTGDLTAARTWTLPDATGVVILSGHTLTGDVTGTVGASGTTALTIAADSVALGTDTTGNYVATLTGGDGISGTASTEGATPTLAIDLLDSADGTSAVTSTNSGLEFQGASNNELALLQGCSDQQLLKWNDTTNVWFCASGSGTSAFDVSDGTTTETIQDSDILTFADGTSVNLVVSATDTVTADVIDDSIDGAELADIITLDAATLSFQDASANTLLTLTDSGSTGTITVGDISCTNCITLGTETSGNYVATLTGGDGISGTASTEGATPTLAIDLLDSADGTSAVTSTNSGLEFQGASNNELALLQGCSDQQLLKWNDTTNVWFCASGSGTSAFDVSDGTTTETIQDSDILTFADGTSVNLVVSATDTVTADVIDDSIDGAELADAITLDSASLVFDDGTNTLLTLTDVGSTGNLTTTGDITISGNDLAFGNGESLTNGTDGTIAFTDGTNTLFSIIDQGTVGNATISGDLTISGDDLFLNTNTSGFILVADGTNYNPVDVSGDVDVDSTGAVTIQADAVALTTDTTGNYVASITNGTSITGADGGSEGATLTLDVADDSINGTELADSITLDAGLTLAYEDAATNSVTDVLTLSHTSSGSPTAGLGTGVSFQIEDAGGLEEQAAIDAVLTTVTDLSEVSDIVFSVQQSGAITEIGRFDGAADAFDISGNLVVDGTTTFNGIAYTWPATQGSDRVLTTNGTGGLSWQTVTGLGAGGDVTAVGNCTTGDCFTGSSGSILTFSTGEVLDASTDGTILFTDGTNNLFSVVDSGTQGQIRLYEATANGSNFTGFSSPTALTADVTYTLPSNDGDSDQVLSTDGSGNLTWVAVTGVGAGTGDISAVGSCTSGDCFVDGSTDAQTLTFEGATDNAFETILQATDPTADNTISLPNASGTIILSGHTFTGDVTATLDSDSSTALSIAADVVDGAELADTITLDAGLVFTQDNSGESVTFDYTDTGSAQTDAFVITGAASTTITDAIDVSDAEIVNALNIGANNIVTSGATISSTELDVLDNGIVLGTETSGSYIATVADAGNSTITVSGSGSETAAVTLDVVDVNCTDCLNATEIEDIYVLNTGDTITGATTIDGSADAIQFTIQGNATQTTNPNLFVVEQSDGTDVFSVTNGGNVTAAGTTTFNGIAYTWPGTIGGNDYVLTAQTDGTLAWANSAATADVISVGDCTSGACFDGTSDGGTYLDLYDAQGAGRLVTGDLTAARTWTLPDATGVVILSGHTLTGDVTGTVGASGTTALTIAADSVALGTDTTGNYVATVADAGSSTITVTNGSGEGGAVTLDVVDVNCTDCLNATEIEDIYVLNTGDTITGATTIDGSADAIQFTIQGNATQTTNPNLFVVEQSDGTDVFSVTNGGNVTAAGTTTFNGIAYTWPGTIGGNDYVLTAQTDGTLAWANSAATADVISVGDCTSGACFDGTSDGGTYLDLYDAQGAGRLVTGDLTAARTWTLPDATGVVILSGHTLTGDVTGTVGASGTTALTIAADSVALGTDTTGNYVASITNGTSITGGDGGSEGAGLVLDVADDSINGTELADTLTLDAGLTVTQSTNTWTQDFAGTTTTGFAYTADDLTTGSAFRIDATNSAASDSAIEQVILALTNSQATAANSDFAGLAIDFTNNPSVAGNTEVVARIQNQATSNITDNTVSALLLLDNADTNTSGSTVVTDGLRISVSGALVGGIVDGVDVSDTNITNALNIGANDIVGTTGAINLSNFDVDASGNVTGVNLTSTGVVDFGGATSFELPSGTSVTTNAAGELALDTNGDATNVTHGVLQYYDGTNTRYIFGSTSFPNTDGYVLTFDSATNAIVWEAAAGSFNSFDLAGDTGTPETVDDGETVTVATDANLTATVGATNTVTISVDADAIDTTELADTLTLGTENLDINLDSTGEFAIQVGASDVFHVADTTGTITISDDLDLSLEAAENFSLSKTAASTVDLLTISDGGNGTTTSGVDGLFVDFTQASDGGADTNAGLNLSFTGSGESGDTLYGANITTSGIAAGTLYGANIAGITAGAGTEYALNIGTGWDKGLYVQSASEFTQAVTLSGDGRPTRQVTLSPEYEGATLSGDGSSNVGTMTSDFCAASAGVSDVPSVNTSVCNASGDLHSYYSWTTAEGTAQDYDIWIRYRIPDNFDSWASNPIDVYGKRTDVTNNAVTVYVYDTSGALENVGGTQVAGTSWTSTTVEGSFAGTYTAGAYMTIRIQLTADTGSDSVQVGEINLDYLTNN